MSPEERQTPEGFFRREASLWKFYGVISTLVLVLLVFCVIAYAEGRVATAAEISTVVSGEVKKQLDTRMNRMESSLNDVQDQLLRQEVDMHDIKKMVRSIR